MNEKHDIGLVAPLPPQTGGVASFAQWLLDSAGEIGVEDRTFDLRRPLHGGVAGRVRRVAVVVLDGWTFVPNPLRFVPESPPKRVGSENVSVLAVGAYGRAKGSDVLIKALADARRQGVPLTLAFVGHELHEGEESYLRRELAELGLEGLVTFAGVLDREEV